MTCPKCEQKDQWGNFCNNCGNQLKEKCPECGKMEAVGRAVCNSKVAEAKKKLLEHTISSGNKNATLFEKYIFLIPVIFIVSWIVSLLITETASMLFNRSAFNSIFLSAILVGLVLLIGSMFFALWLDNKYGPHNDKRKEIYKQEFFRLHPDLAEIIKKAEGG